MSIFSISLNLVQASALGAAIIVLASLIIYSVVHQRRLAESLRSRVNACEAEIASLRDLHHESVIHLLHMQSGYTNGINDMRKQILRKLTSGKTTEVRQLLASQNIIDEQCERFTDVFDRMFLNLYPTFVSDINELLLHDKRFSDLTEGQLNHELRILALRRLGIDDSTTIASTLGLAVNTIYTYANRTRSRAIDRESFYQHLTVAN